MKLFKILFSLLFLVLAVLWIMYTISFFGLYTKGWETLTQLGPIAKLNTWIQEYIVSRGNASSTAYFGLKLFLAGGAVLLGYTAIFFPLKKIPFFGSLIKTLTFIIPTIGTLCLIIGAILLWGNISVPSIPGLDKITGGSSGKEVATVALNLFIA
ncbi:hypothetical protein [Malacoplasma iowae]|uniref:hypothetical protein n=1 Tax=Malacoplasma iowae TaxID=2116 RepID=UPI003872C5CF|nr:hypothetical protein QX181_01145 [Malacoplasma iowae]